MDHFMEDIYVFNIATCIVLGIVLLFTKSTHPHLQNYLIAKRVIALALFLVAAGVIINLFVGDVNDSKVEILNITTLIVSDLQIILLTFTLMTLYYSHLVSRKNIYTVLFPLIVLLLIYSITLIIYGDTAVYSHEEYFRNLTQEPALIIRTLIFTWGIISVIICINWFLKARQEFNKAIDNYFDGAKELHIKWVTAIFSVSLILLALVIMSYIIILPYWDAFARTGITILFTIISIQFLNYPQLLKVIYPALETAEEVIMSPLISNNIAEKLKNWEKNNNKPYTREGITVGELADEIKENKRMVSKYLNTNCNTNFNTWINTLRIEEAIRLLENNGLPLHEIAERTGFSDLAKMSNFMKKHTGLSPSEYRKVHYNKP